MSGEHDIRAVFFDVDGTLLSHKLNDVPPETIMKRKPVPKQMPGQVFFSKTMGSDG